MWLFTASVKSINVDVNALLTVSKERTRCCSIWPCDMPWKFSDETRADKKWQHYNALVMYKTRNTNHKLHCIKHTHASTRAEREKASNPTMLSDSSRFYAKSELKRPVIFSQSIHLCEIFFAFRPMEIKLNFCNIVSRLYECLKYVVLIAGNT